MKNKSFFLIVVLLFINLNIYAEKISKKNFLNKGKICTIDVESNGFGSDVFIHSKKKKNLSLTIGGENLFPEIFQKRDKYFITWINYKKNSVKLCYYNSKSDESVLIGLRGFRFVSSSTSLVYRSGKPFIILFRGIKDSDNEDIFLYRIGEGTVKRVTFTDGNEKNIEIPEVDIFASNSFLMNTKTLYFSYSYKVNLNNFSVILLKKEKIIRNPVVISAQKSEAEIANTIVAFGDSITWGKMRMNDLEGEEHPELTYWYKASEYLTEHYGKTYTVNLGINGNRSYQGVERMDHDFSLNPGYYCLVLFGTNDVGSGTFSADSSVENIEWIMNNSINTYHMFPIVSTIPPIKKYLPGVQFYKENTEELNAKILEMAVKNGFSHFDTYTAFMNYSGGWESLLEDIKGNHPNPTGHQIMADFVVPLILSDKPKKSEVLNMENSLNYINIECVENHEFDFDSYEVNFGYSPEKLEFTTKFQSNHFSLLRSPIGNNFRNKIYFKIDTVDKSGNRGGSTKIYSAKFGK